MQMIVIQKQKLKTKKKKQSILDTNEFRVALESFFFFPQLLENHKRTTKMRS